MAIDSDGIAYCDYCGEDLNPEGHCTPCERATTGEDDHDGQPDEMQEWHDFDPDC